MHPLSTSDGWIDNHMCNSIACDNGLTSNYPTQENTVLVYIKGSLSGTASHNFTVPFVILLHVSYIHCNIVYNDDI